MSFDNMDSNDNPNSILIIVLIKISIIISRDWNNKSFEKKMEIKKSKFQEKMNIGKSRRI